MAPRSALATTGPTPSDLVPTDLAPSVRPTSSDRLSQKAARRIALAAQGFSGQGFSGRGTGADRDAATPGRAQLRRMIDRLGVLQIDSVNVIARAHTLPGFSRLGSYTISDLNHLAYAGRRRVLFEYWGHEASYLPVSLQPLFRWRMARAAAGEDIYTGLARWGRERADIIDEVRREIADRGPIAASDLSRVKDGGDRGAGGWWGWSEGKRALEWLFWAGEITTATRRGAFERVYDLTDRVLPPAILAMPTPDPADARRDLMRVAASALGIASQQCMRDYYRFRPADASAAIADLVESGELRPVEVKGWARPAYLWHKARHPRRVAGRALLAPFDPLIWCRGRVEALFGARIRLEIYTPAHKRQYGYYVLPFLLGDSIAARLDLKADRAAGLLRVCAAHVEPGFSADAVAGPLAAELALMARWLGLTAVAIDGRGELANALDGPDIGICG